MGTRTLGRNVASWTVALVLTGLTATVHADPVPASAGATASSPGTVNPEIAGQVATEVRNRAVGAGKAVFRYLEGPQPVEQPPRVEPEQAVGLDCAQLYQVKLALHRQQYNQLPTYLDDDRNRTIIYFGTVAGGGYSLLGLTAFNHLHERQRIRSAENQLQALQRLSAQKNCFPQR